MNKFSTDNHNEEEEIDLREILFKYIRHWKWFVISVIICSLFGALAYLKLDRKYDVSTAVLLKEDKGAKGSNAGPLGGLQELGLLSTTNNIDNEIAVFSSPNLMKQVVLSLELHTTYFEKGFFRDTEIYKKSPIYVNLQDTQPGDIHGGIELDVSFTQEGVLIKGIHRYQKEETSFVQELSSLTGLVELPNGLGKLYVTSRPEIIKEGKYKNNTYKIYINNAQRVAYSLAKEIGVAATTKQSSVLNITLPSLNVSKSIDFLKELVVIYNNNNVRSNTETARNTSQFIDERLKGITAELSDVENKVVDYKQQEGIADIGTEAKTFVEQTSEVEKKRIEIETQLKTIELIEKFVFDSSNDNKMIPNIGLSDLGLSKVIAEYNDLLLQYDKLVQSTNENSPSRKVALANLENTRESIKSSLINVKNAMNISKRETGRQIASISAKIGSIPSQEKGLLDIMRQQSVKQALFIYLMQVKEETNITMASTADKAEIITDPIIPEKPTSPKKSIILMASMLLAIIIPVGIIFIKDKLEVNISGREDLEALAKPSVIGEIMKKDDKDPTLVVSANRTTPIVELFRTLRNNVQFILDAPDKKVILVTSTIPGEGKTFISANLATSFAISDKKVLLIGLDVRNPKLSTDMGFTKGPGVTSYLSGAEPNWKSMVMKLKEFPNMDILQAGAIPPNPNELIMKPELKQLVMEAREQYDIVIIDSAPIGVVSDTFLVSSLADTTVYVTREGVTPKGAINFINTVHLEDKLPKMFLVINGVDLNKKKVGYGRYTYGYGKTYGYGGTK